MEQTPSIPQPVVDYHVNPKPESGSWLNLRVLVFAAVVLSIIGYMSYLYFDVAATHGIKRNGEMFQVDLKSMSTFSFDQTHGTIDDVPARYRELNGKKVSLIGEMWAPNATGPQIPKFELVYSISKCCFSGPPQIQHFVQATSSKGLMPFYDGLVRISGTLTVNVTKDPDGKITGIYHLNVESLEPV